MHFVTCSLQGTTAEPPKGKFEETAGIGPKKKTPNKQGVSHTQET
jgi:hypothetical protein